MRSLITIMAGLLMAGLNATTASADERRFTFVYEATVIEPGEVEYEQWITWKTEKDTDTSFDRIDFRHEVEFGVTAKLQLALYLSDWRYQDGRSVQNDGAEWRDVALETIYQVTDPVVAPIGVAAYGEVKFGDELFELEAKIILQKNIGKWVVAYNGTIEAEWEGQNYEIDSGKFEQTLGASYQISPALTVGTEFLHEIKYDDWSVWNDHVLYAGPNVSFRAEGWWVTMTALAQVTSVESEANFLVRVLFGIDF